jgi:hypothetical protein
MLGMRVDPGAIATEDAHQQEFRGERSRRNAGALEPGYTVTQDRCE